MREFTKVPGSKINIQKSTAFLCVNNEQSNNKIEKTIPFTTALKRVKYLRVSLTKGM